MIGIADSFKNIIVPAGIIFPYDNLLSNLNNNEWEQFTLANDRYIIGGSSAGAIGIKGLEILPNGNISQISENKIRYSSALGGKHSGTIESQTYQNGGNITIQIGYYEEDHHHNIQISPTIKYNQLIFVKAKKNLNMLPPEILLLSTDNLPLTYYSKYNNTNYLKCGNANESNNTSYIFENINFTPEFGISGNHEHIGVGDQSFTALTGTNPIPYYLYTSGYHQHTLSSESFTENLKRIYISTWSNATKKFPICKKAIGMWESSIPPKGWAICDGTNGTPNMIDHFINFDSNNQGGAEGNNSITANISLNNYNWTHDHLQSTKHISSGGLTARYAHGYNTIYHNHTANFPSIDWNIWQYMPPYYTLVFIQKI